MGPSNPSQAARRLEETPDTRAEIQAGTSTLANAAALAAAAEECGARRVDENAGLWAEATRANRMISVNVPPGWPTNTARIGAAGGPFFR